MPEFTGERVIPGEVELDLLNEHMARYAFAARLASGKRVLDAACGTGYGSAELARVAASVAGVDIAAEAVAFARSRYAAPKVWFEQADCLALPHRDGSFDLVVAFEVIEHLANWRGFLLEMRRLLAPGGQFIVSTPNRLYYAESRGAEGPNPFHVHEFDYAEFGAELAAVFPHVSLFLENHVEGFTFQAREGGAPSEVRVESGGAPPDESHFFVAVCAHRTQLGNPTFVYIPKSGNVLREREHHIHLLQQELRDKDRWLGEAHQQRDQLLVEHQRLEEEFTASQSRVSGIQDELARANQWAQSLNRELEESRAENIHWAESLNRQLEECRARILALQDEVAGANQWAQSLNRELEESHAHITNLQNEMAGVHAGYSAKVRELEEELDARARWATDLDTRLEAATRSLEERAALIRLQEEHLEALKGQLLRQQQMLDFYRASRWMKLGEKIGFGPGESAH